MSIKSRADLAGMRAVGRVVGETLRELRQAVRPGVTTASLDELAARALRRRRARAAPAVAFGFPGSCCISVNDEAVHGVPGPRELRPGDLVKLDVTADLDGYVADSAITVAVPPVAERTSRLAECAEAALDRALNAARAGRPVSAIGRAVEREVSRRGFHVLSELRGHGTGRAIWENPSVPNIELPTSERLTEGLVIAIEPIIAAGPDRVVEQLDGWTLRTRAGSLAAHAEHTVVIRTGKPLILTAV
jgi:methionyl aminopeptidase